jgi:spheroidene monooxygenase
MQTTTISFFRFESTPAKLWAFSQMQFARGPLRRTPGVSFCKLMGSGTGESFHPKPNFSVYAILLIWPSHEAARFGLSHSAVLARYRNRSAESLTVVLQAQMARGLWDGAAPFQFEDESGYDAKPLGVLTRATLKTNILLDFWKTVPTVSDELAEERGLLFKLGMGEVPWLQQVTFSIWKDEKDMYAFAYRSPAHREAIRLARHHQWFKEDLFARFRIVGVEGTWDGSVPVKELTPA